MKALKHENLLELKGKVLDLITRTSVEIGHRSDAKTLAALSTIFSEDLIQEKRFGNMTFNQVIDAFRLGVRFGKEEPFLNIRTFYRWLYAHKKVIDNAWYEVHTLGKSKEQTLYYQEPLKLIR
tara:strand:+ start:157 stop:525 length:369 start_codon:yes stop_codon:yes gene_type:complete